MNTLSVFLWTVIVLAALVIIYRKLTYTISVDKYEYLTVMSFEWKDGKEIRLEMQRKKKGRISGPRFYQQLSQLEDEGFVEHRIDPRRCEGQTVKITQFRKTINKNRKGPEEGSEEKSPSQELVPIGA